jgi:hydroxymethylpyrimidine pyrophosphatase-like HAD family hydrolase
MEAIQAELSTSPWSHLTVLRTGFAIHVMDPCLSKGQGLAQVLNRLEVAPEDVLAVGDAPNDLSMFDLVGWSVAVGGAFPEVEAVASVCSPEPHGATFPPLAEAILAAKKAEG